jgi:hypothetical protein
LIDVRRNVHLAGCHVLVHTSLPLLPLARPEPGLIGRHRDLRTQLDYSVIPLDDFDLSTRSVEVVASSEIGRQHDLAPPAHAHKRPLAHAEIVAELR